MNGSFVVPLSYGQARLWLLDRLSDGAALYTIPAVLRLSTPVDQDVLARTLREIVRRHEMLRTTYPLRHGAPVQLVCDRFQCELHIIDLEHLPREAREEEARRKAAEEARLPFDLETGPLFRPTLIKIAPSEHLLLATFHHIVADGWSLRVFFRELKAIYSAFIQRLPSPLADLKIQYADYAVWQRRWLESGVMRQQLDYWGPKLDAVPPLDLPSDRTRTVMAGTDSARVGMTIPDHVARGVAAASRQQGVTAFMFLLAAFQVLLGRYCGQEDFAVASPVAGRTRPETEDLIGFFVNMLVLRADLRGDPPFRELLRRVRETTLEAYEQQDTPFECLVERLQPVRYPGRNPLAQVMFSVQNSPLSSDMAEEVRSGWETDRGTANFDLAVDLWSTSSGLECRWEYKTDLFDHGMIDRMMHHYEALLTEACARPDECLSRLRLLHEAERESLLRTGHGPKFECEGTVWTYFSDQAAKTPGAIAVAGPQTSLTYREVDERSNRLAHYLKQRGLGSGDIAAVALRRRELAPIALLGVIKAGAAYLPVQPVAEGVGDRSWKIVEDAGVRLIVTDAPVAHPQAATGLVNIVDDWPTIAEHSAASLPSSGRSGDPAYVIYTSGSTGRPKGVIVPHRALANHSQAIRDRYGLSAADRVLQFAPLSFDVAAEEMFPTWVAGGTVVCPGGSGPLSFHELRELIAQQQVSVLNLPASYWQEWVDHLRRNRESLPAGLRLVVVGSERVSPEHLRLWQRLSGPAVRWMNAYGVTEATITATTYEPQGEVQGTNVPIGQPIANVQAYILDRNLQVVPSGVYGELYLGGLCLADGYLHHPQMTADRFVSSPFAAGERLYRTGDIVRLRDDGNLEFAGRSDTQLKIAGYRVEPGEIESVLLRHPAVTDAAVGSFDRVGAGSALAGWFAGEADPRDLREFLRGLLPPHMIPSVFVRLARMPRLANDKIDRAALPVPTASERCSEARVAPRNAVERQVAELWCKVLGVDEIGVTDNFFDMGGHSLLATQLISRIRAAIGYEIPLRDFFELPTVAGLATSIANGAASHAAHDTPVPVARHATAADVDLMSDEEVDELLQELLACNEREEES